LKEDVIHLILQAERDYNKVVKQAISEAEQYVDACKDKQSAYVQDLEHTWSVFEKAENEKLESRLLADEQRLEAELQERKRSLDLRQQEKAELISKRLKEEVLSFNGNR